MLRRNSAKTDYPIASREEADQIALHLDRLAAIEAAVPGEVGARARGFIPHLRDDAFVFGERDLNGIADVLGSLLAIVGKQQEQIQALTEGVRIYRAADCPFGQPVQIREWETKHGHLVPQVESPTKSELNSAPDQVN